MPSTTLATGPTRVRRIPKVGPRVAPRVPEGFVEQAPTRFTLTPHTPTIGATVHGVSMADPVDAELKQQLNHALLVWKVLFFRDQHITAAQHRDFAANWGLLEQHPFANRKLSGQPGYQADVLRIAKDANARGTENLWHSDVTWRLSPSLGSILRAVEVPDVGGDTLFADMAAAYDCLSDETKTRIDSMVAVHDWLDSFGKHMSDDERDELRKDFPAAQHPVVRTHPETKRKTLFVNGAFTERIVGLSHDESEALLAELYHQAEFPEFQVRLRWEPGTVAFWDNRSTQHYASSDYYPKRRVMERITIVGDEPY